MLILVASLALQGTVPDSLTLDEALARARENRGQIVAARALVEESRAAYRVAGAVPNPTISYSHTESAPRQHLLVDQPLDWLLRRGHQRTAARHGIGAAEADSSQAVADLDREVTVAFYTARAAVIAEQLTADRVTFADSVASIGAARLRAGDISLLESEQGQAEAARARLNLSSIRENARVAASDLARAIGADPSAPPLPAGELDTRLDSLAPGIVTVDRVPAVRAAVADSAAAVALAQSASIGRIPLPTLQTGAEWDDPTEPDRALAVIGVALPLPLWHQHGGTVAEARARALAASARVREARLDAVTRIESARIHLEESRLRARFSRDTLLSAAREVRGRALRAYQAGETGVLPVIEALRSERDAVLSSVQDLLSYQTALAEWEWLLGSHP